MRAASFFQKIDGFTFFGYNYVYNITLLSEREIVMDDLGGRLKRYRAAVVILAAALAASILLSAFFALDGWRAARGGVCLVTVRENGAVMDADRFRIVGPLDAKAGGSGYSFRIDLVGLLLSTSILSQNSPDINLFCLNFRNLLAEVERYRVIISHRVPEEAPRGEKPEVSK